MANCGRGRVALALLLASGRAHAFSVRNHEALTRAAVKQLEVCVTSRGAADRGLGPVGENDAALIRCNVAQDNLIRKLLVWHFYSPDRKLEKDTRLASLLGALLFGAVAIDTTLEQWFSRLTAELNAATNRADAYTALGALSHFLQDVAVPGHVVPVFHPDPPFNVDNFDYYGVVETPVRTDDAYCDQLLSRADDSLEGVLRETAAYTLAALGRDIPGLRVADDPARAVPRTWRLFWQPPAPESDGFGRYGCVGDRFGEVNLRCDRTDVFVSAETYRAFAHELQQRAIEATARAIVVMQRQIAKEGPRTVQGCPVPTVHEGPGGGHILAVAREGW